MKRYFLEEKKERHPAAGGAGADAADLLAV